METNQTEECECGHPKDDHYELHHLNTDDTTWVCHACSMRNPLNPDCTEYRPKDAQYYADLDYDARAEKYERSRE